MKYTDEHLDEAVKNNIFTDEQVGQFRRHILNSGKQVSKPLKVLYYLGGLLIISAMTWLMQNSWISFGPRGISFISALYFAAFLIAGYFVFFKKNMELAGGLLFSIPIAVTPLFVFSILQVFDFWEYGWKFNDFFIWTRGSWIRERWIILEISTILVAIPILLKTKFPFHVFLISVALWFFSMDIVAVIGQTHSLSWTERAFITRIFGCCMIAAGYFADFKFKKDYSFWLYLFGSMTLFSGLSAFFNHDISGFIWLGIVSVLMILFSLFINRNVILVFGAIGLIQFLSRLSWEFFRGSVFFPFSITLIGLLLISLGIFFQKNRNYINENVIKKLPKFILDLRPKKI